MVFMASGMAVATATQSAVAAGIAAKAAPLAWPASDVSNSGALLVASALLAMLGLCKAGQEVSDSASASTFDNLHLIIGFLNCCYSSVTGMVCKRCFKLCCFVGCNCSAGNAGTVYSSARGNKHSCVCYLSLATCELDL